PREACLEALKRLARNFNNDKEWLSSVGINFYALRKDGEHGGAGLWTTVDRKGERHLPRYVVNDDGASRFVDGAHLLERRET
ncbi:MAG: glycosylasparaginase, partial [Acidobacteria bacterium]|nr:glycosylasparaginase [Acidobacteriota bacterium]